MDLITEGKSEIRDSAGGDKSKKSFEENLQEWLDRKKEALMLVASLLATMGFQIAVNPPGGVWQDYNYLYDKNGFVDPQGNRTNQAVDQQNKNVSVPHKAGHAVLASRDSGGYDGLIISNTIGFVCSLSVIILLVSGLPIRNKFCLWVLIVILWVAIYGTAATYIGALRAVTPTTSDRLEKAIGYSLLGWMGLASLILIVHVIRLFCKMLKKLWRGLVKVVRMLTGRSSKAAPSAARPAV